MAEPWLIRFFACNREMQPFSFFFLLFVVGAGGGGGNSGRVRALNLTVPLGSGRVGSDDLGYGPGSGFSFEPVQTSSSRKGSGHPKRLPFKDYRGHCALRNLKCSRIFFVTLARSVPCHNSVSELFRQFLWPHDSHLLWHALWAVRSYIDRCVAFLIKSNQYNQTQPDSNEVVEPFQGWSEEMDSTWVKYMSITAKGLNT